MEVAAEVEGEGAGLDDEPGRIRLGVPEAELLRADLEADGRGLADADMTAGEPDEAPDRPGHGGDQIPHVELHNLVAVAAAGIRDLNTHPHLLASPERGQREAAGGQPRVDIPEGGVAAAVAEVKLGT